MIVTLPCTQITDISSAAADLTPSCTAHFAFGLCASDFDCREPHVALPPNQVPSICFGCECHQLFCC